MASYNSCGIGTYAHLSGGNDDWLPIRDEHTDNSWLESEIESLLMDGYSVREIAAETGWHLSHITRFIKERGLTDGQVAL